MSGSVCRRLDSKTDIATVADRWKAQYEHGGDWGTLGDGQSSEVIYRRLKRLGTTATPADVARVIGNGSWIGHSCDHCHDNAARVWQIGEEPDHESATVTLCRKCMDKLVKFYERSR